MRHLPVDHVARHDHALLGGADAAHELHGVADRRERVAQLVRQHGEELVLAPVRVLQLFLGLARARDLALQGRIKARVVERDGRARHQLLEHQPVLRLACGVAQGKRTNGAVADAQRMAQGGAQAGAAVVLARFAELQHRVERRAQRRRHEVLRRCRECQVLARLLLQLGK